MANPKNILITGASGLIGTQLTKEFLAKGYNVSHLGRSPKKGKIPSYTWNIETQTCDPQAFEGIGTIIHLTGAGVAEKRWTKQRKKEILESRTHSTRLLFKMLSENKHQVRSVISASAIGYYGFQHPEEVFHENSPKGNDFLATVVDQWENEIDKLNTLNLRVVKVRIGIVLSERDGMIKEISRPVKWFVGSPLGTGNQYVSWIHIDDLCNIFQKAVDDERLAGPYNATAITPATNREITKAIAHALHRPVVMPAVPGWVLKILLGEMADMICNGSRVSSEKIRQTGFEFRFNNLEPAVNNLLKKS